MKKAQVQALSTKPIDEVTLSNGKTLKIPSVKIKYLLDHTFYSFMLIDQMGIVELMNHRDGLDFIINFLSAVFDDVQIKDVDVEDTDDKGNVLKDDNGNNKMHKEKQEVRGEKVREMLKNMTLDDIKNIIVKVKEVNDIKDSDFTINPTAKSKG